SAGGNRHPARPVRRGRLDGEALFDVSRDSAARHGIRRHDRQEARPVGPGRAEAARRTVRPAAGGRPPHDRAARREARPAGDRARRPPETDRRSAGRRRHRRYPRLPRGRDTHRADRRAAARCRLGARLPRGPRAPPRNRLAAARPADVPADPHDYREDEPRTALIDELLHDAGWALASPEDREYPVGGLPILPGTNETGTGRVDYVLWGEDGLPL